MKTLKYQTILWDLDGTLLNTLQDLANAFNAGLAAHGYPARTMEEVRAAVGNGGKTAVAALLPGGQENPDFEAVFESFRAYYALHSEDNTRPYPGLDAALQALQAAGAAMGIVSNKMDDAVKALNRRHFGFPVAIGESEGVRRKPAPDTVLRALEGLGRSREGCVYIGDSEVDLATARNAGLPCIAVAWGFRGRARLEALQAPVIADTPEQLLMLLGL